ncbi:hypothetical protein GLOTRDRAFT_141631 [Gloeophyllum trabeum ATCC 11539]|uniref:Uncharacterized protein n=1 Tax=Gloeophyllum trabeum (strain ATCC 11539 / FP-39264 / Madison 617) TaxID=670483 RepID=S7RCG4_GLOTA|nr:uncharacterized protein GLOTRDRAFT_141631 [Gloeophyllum trabeum ATCC 11539]EPQ50079.1 hypothetical protein GLOTRDRAFT_141631 [Gloeophyllum trabeum ATCC 11539]
MSTLRITFDEDEYWRPEQLQMTGRQFTDTAVIDIDTTEEIHHNSRTTVYRGQTQGIRALLVLKFAHSVQALEDLRREASLYQKQLFRLQGTVIPICYGFFEAVHDTFPLGCLILEDCGDPPDIIFPFLPMVTRFVCRIVFCHSITHNQRVRITILRYLQEIHRCGVVHQDFRERNVVLRDGKPRIIDFDRVSPHKGGCTMEIRKLPSVPHNREVDCNDIYCYCYDFQIWGGTSFNGLFFVSIFTGPVDLVDIGRSPYPQEGLPPQEVIDVLIPSKAIYLKDEATQRLLLDRLHEINEELERGVALEAIEFGIVFVLGRPFRPASDYPPQGVVDDLLRGFQLYDLTPQQVESVAHVLREAKLACSVTTEKVREKINECLHYLNRYRVLRDKLVFSTSH